MKIKSIIPQGNFIGFDRNNSLLPLVKKAKRYKRKEFKFIRW